MREQARLPVEPFDPAPLPRATPFMDVAPALTRRGRLWRLFVTGLHLAGVILPGLIALFLVLRAFVDGNTADLRYGVGLLVILGLTLFLPDRARVSSLSFRSRALLLMVFLLAVVAVFPLTVVVLIFGKVDMAAFVFHLIFGMDGTPWGDIVPYIATAAILWTAIIVTLARLMRMMPARPAAGLALMLVAGTVGMNPLVYDLMVHRAHAAFGPARTLMPEFRAPVIRDAPARPDLVILYLEGFERGYLDAARFGPIAAPLAELEEQGIAFTNVQQIEGTGWSLAGTTATQCGTPLLPFGARPLGETSLIRLIKPEVTCLTDVLAARGYDITYMSGAKIVGNQMGYYGFDNFFSTHGPVTIKDRDTIPTPRTARFGPEDWDDWGLFDSELLDGAAAVIREKARAAEAPFAVFVATMDTHGPVATISPACRPDAAPPVSEDMRDAVRCVAGLVARFVETLRAEHGPDLRIAVMSDHLNHASNLTGLLEQAPRANTVMLLGGQTAPRVIDRPAAMVDIYPTLLDWLGLLPPDAEGAGLGVSLLRGGGTLVERLGKAEVDAILRVDTQLAAHLWRNAGAAED